MLDIPPALLEEIRNGRVVLFLGAGASFGARSPNGQTALSSTDLRDRISERFLGGQFKDQSLAWITELAISETDLSVVQDFIADLLKDLRPASFHKLLPTFRWRGLATTNYDRVIESAYGDGKPVQTLVPLTSDRDRLDEKLNAPNSLGLLKLHGCITRTHEPDLPLILTTDQYVTHRAGRKYLFQAFESWAFEHPVVFVGHGGQDPDLRAILLEASKDPQSRPRFYLVRPNVPDAEKRLWESKRISVIDATFEQLLTTLDRKLPAALRPLLQVVNAEQPIRRRYAVAEDVGTTIVDLLQNDVEYLHTSTPVPSGTPQAFYKGFDLGWYPIANNLDVRRRLTDSLLNDIIVRSESERPTITELYVVKAEAGAGKSVFLKRLAWEAANQADMLCLFARNYGNIPYDSLRELHRVTQQRVFLFVDNAADHASLLGAILQNARRDRLPLTVFTAERVNVWNMACEHLAPLVTDSFALKYLSRGDIESLVALLAKHKSLGPNLTGRPLEYCVQQFDQQAGRQLLVALHEATMGVPFEDILVDEYNEIQPAVARNLYLTVCVLNRLNVLVRAGLIARIHEIPFEHFREKLFAPLEHVVTVHQHPGTQDFLYAARHQEIAQIVFGRILATPRDRYNEYIRIIAQLNLGYSVDREAFRGLIRARTLNELFPDYDDVRSIFELAERISDKEAYLYQQQAIYERIRPNGNLVHAERLLERARALDARDTTIIHTLAELKRARAEAAQHPLERQKYRKEARSLLSPLLSDASNDLYARHTLVKLAIDDLRDLLGSGNATDREIDAAVRAVETPLRKALQHSPDEHFLLTAEADFSKLLNDYERSFSALRRAFDANPRDPYIALRLARLYEGRGKSEEAMSVLRTALDANRGNMELNYEYGTLLRKTGFKDLTTLLYHFRRSFTKWDTNYEAQFWFARYAFESSDAGIRTEARDTFHRLREAPMSYDARVRIRDVIRSEGNEQLFWGSVVRCDYTIGFVSRDGIGDWLFLHKNNVDTAVWETLQVGSRVAFAIGFTLNGPVACKVARM